MPLLISIIYCIKDRDPRNLRNCLRTLTTQDAFDNDIEIVLVDYGSQMDFRTEYRNTCAQYDARLISVDPVTQFCKTHALNIGIRHSNPNARYVLCSDVDMLYARNFMATLTKVLTEKESRFVTCGHYALKPGAAHPDTDVIESFDRLCDPKYHESFRCWPGPCQAASREWVFRVRGLDERFVRYGPEDADLQRRAARSGLEVVWIHDRTTLLHQWHLTQWQMAQETAKMEEQLLYFNLNQAYYLADKTIARNDPDKWGAIPENDK